MYKLFPSKGWEVYISLQVMHQSSLHAPNETMVTLFYEDSNLYQVPGGVVGRLGGAAAWLTPAHLATPSHAADVPFKQPARPDRQEACTRGAASDVPAAQQPLLLAAARVRRYWVDHSSSQRAPGRHCPLPAGRQSHPQ